MNSAQIVPPRDIDLTKVTTPVFVHLLRSELRFPKLFMLRCKLTFGPFKKMIDPRFPPELVELVALQMWVYINLKSKLGQEKAFEIMRLAILTGGVVLWNISYRAVERQRTFANLCELELEVNKTGITRWNTLEVVDRTDRRFQLKVTRCLYHELATSLGIPELTPVICQIDNACFNSYVPDQILFHRGGSNHRIADGADECTFIWERCG